MEVKILKEKRKNGEYSNFSVKNQNFIQDMFDSNLKDVTLYDYLNNLFNYNLIKTNESFFCQCCEKNTVADKIYKLYELPNALILTLTFKGGENAKYLKLADFFEIDFQDFVEDRYLNKNSNIFKQSKKKDGFKYDLKSVIIYSNVSSCHEGYTTYVKDDERGGWIKFSRYDVELVPQSEIEIIHFPYILIFQRRFNTDNERSNLSSQLKLQREVEYTDIRPIPDHWMQKAVYLHSPSKLYISHHLCKHFKLRPCYKDVYIKPRNDWEMDTNERKIFYGEDFTDRMQDKKKDEEEEEEEEMSSEEIESSDNQEEEAKVKYEEEPQDPKKKKIDVKDLKIDIKNVNSDLSEGEEEDESYFQYTYTLSKMESHSTYLPAPIAEYIVEKYCADVTVEEYKKSDFDHVCEICLEFQKKFLKRRILEKRLVVKYEELETDRYFVVASDWIFKWKLYLFHDVEDDKFMKKYFFDSFDLPRQIENKHLLKATGDVKDGIEQGKDFRFVNSHIWEIFANLHGFDVAIGKEKKDINSENLPYEKGTLENEDLKMLNKIKEIFNKDNRVDDEDIMNLLEDEEYNPFGHSNNRVLVGNNTKILKNENKEKIKKLESDDFSSDDGEMKEDEGPGDEIEESEEKNEIEDEKSQEYTEDEENNQKKEEDPVEEESHKAEEKEQDEGQVEEENDEIEGEGGQEEDEQEIEEIEEEEKLDNIPDDNNDNNHHLEEVNQGVEEIYEEGEVIEVEMAEEEESPIDEEDKPQTDSGVEELEGEEENFSFDDIKNPLEENSQSLNEEKNEDEETTQTGFQETSKEENN